MERTMTLRRRKVIEALIGYAFIAPTMLGFIVFLAIPMLVGISLMFFNWSMFKPPEFVGLENIQAFLQDPRVLTVYKTTFGMAFGLIISNLTLGLGIALLLNAKMPGVLSGFFRAAYFFPTVVSTVVVAVIWQFLLNKDLGLVNYYLGLLGVDRINWLLSSTWSPIAVIITDTWKNVGFYALIFLGGLKNIPRDYYEAAEVDGATTLHKFRYITMPLLTPTMLFLIITSTIGAMQIFGQSFILTGGGPGDATRTIVMYIYESGIRSFRVGYGAVLSVSLLLVIVGMTTLQFILSRRYIHYQ
ncbi:MAG: sugar ABC transporter permease [Anaerolineae bacterium]|nr:sugar ABC transporter permease [Anaerolineae bacterium]